MTVIAELPETDRPRERLLAHGAATLADRELLALLLGSGGSAGLGAHALAERLLARFGSLRWLARAQPCDLTTVAGIGEAKAATVVAAFELARRVGEPVDAPERIGGSADLARLTAPMLRGRDREQLVVVCCDRSNRVLACERVAEGAAGWAMLPVREVLVSVLRRDGQALGLAHNHPGGRLDPSSEDVAATRRIAEAAEAVGLRFLDHVIVTDTEWRRVTVDR
jgi:DNA repair protein RadC